MSPHYRLDFRATMTDVRCADIDTARAADGSSRDQEQLALGSAGAYADSLHCTSNALPGRAQPRRQAHRSMLPCQVIAQRPHRLPRVMDDAHARGHAHIHAHRCEVHAHQLGLLVLPYIWALQEGFKAFAGTLHVL